jgi:hypothetical protein
MTICRGDFQIEGEGEIVILSRKDIVFRCEMQVLKPFDQRVSFQVRVGSVGLER